MVGSRKVVGWHSGCIGGFFGRKMVRWLREEVGAGGECLRDLNGLEEVRDVKGRHGAGTVDAVNVGGCCVCRVYPSIAVSTNLGGVACNQSEEGLGCVCEDLVCTLSTAGSHCQSAAEQTKAPYRQKTRGLHLVRHLRLNRGSRRIDASIRHVGIWSKYETSVAKHQQWDPVRNVGKAGGNLVVGAVGKAVDRLVSLPRLERSGQLKRFNVGAAVGFDCLFYRQYLRRSTASIACR